MTGGSWYPMAAMRRINTPIRVRWNGFEGTAVWLRAKTGDAPRWVQPVKHAGGAGFEPLPSRQQRTFPANARGDDVAVTEHWLEGRGWGPEPECWQPIGEWLDPLPDPLTEGPHHDSRFSTIGGVAFDAATAAAEMEEMREAARCRPNNDGVAEDGLPWWRDPAAINYAPRGQITARDAEGRVMRALYFLGGREPALARYRSNAAVLADLMEARDWGKSDFSGTHIPRLAVTRSDTADRLLEAMRWACELMADRDHGWRWFAVLERRARNEPQSWSRIADVIGAERTSALRSYARAITRVTVIANSGTPHLDRRLAEIQKGNRRHADTR